ncbi:hypothetical protein [Methanobrevibacter sp.]|uniref:hypothetical protein n=1 Tax=Methanobrevibacter sp. TaxID=66852 RepID=UPI0038903AFF
MALVNVAQDCIQALGSLLDLYVVTINNGEGIVATNSFQEKPKFSEKSPYVPFMLSGISLYEYFICFSPHLFCLSTG